LTPLMPLAIVIDLNPNIVRLGPLLITWHGVFAVLGIVAAARLGFWLLGKDGVDLKGSGDGLAWMVVLGLIGARVLYVWENFRLFTGGQFLRVFALTEGGISQWGGLFGAMFGAYIWARLSRFSFWKIIDAGGAAAMIGLTIGRIGDVINGEHHGTPTTLPWGVEYVNAATLGEPGKVVHPEVAYEMVLCLLILAALLPFHQRIKKRTPDGVIGLTYFALYGAGRFFLSFLRTDPGVLLGLRQAQIASGVVVAVAIIAVPVLFRRAASALAPAPETAAVTEPAPEAPAVTEPALEAPAVTEPALETSAVAEQAPETPVHVESTHEPPHEPPAPTAPQRSRVGRKRRQRSRAAGESKPPS
jgi:phosphatidylglycerol:prolipoprotein diacylglycerol transferase